MKTKEAEQGREAEETAFNERLVQVSDDLNQLYMHVGDAVREGAGDVKQRWDAMRRSLEEKRSAVIVRAQKLKSAGKAASVDLQEGFEGAYSELKEAIQDARDKFT